MGSGDVMVKYGEPRRGKVSLFFPQMTKEPRDFRRFAEVVRDTALHRLWPGQSFVMDSGHLIAAAAGSGVRVPVGLSVSLLPLRHPYETAMQARSVAMFTEKDSVICLGTATPEFVAGLYGEPYARPLRVAAEYVRIVRALLDGEHVVEEGEHFQMHGRLIAARAPHVEVGLGVLRQGMARVAGRHADVAVSLLAPPAHLREVIAPTLAEAGRERDRRSRLVTIAHVVVDRRARDPRVVVAPTIAMHIRQENYGRMLRDTGISVDPADPVMTAGHLIDSGTVLTGDPDDIARQIHELHLTGVDEVVLNLAGVMFTDGLDTATEEAHAIASTWKEVHLGV